MRMLWGRFSRLLARPDPMCFDLLLRRRSTSTPLDPQKLRVNTFAFVVAQAHWFLFRKDYLHHILNCLELDGCEPMPRLSDEEFLECLEFRLGEIERVLAGGENRFHWPSAWPTEPGYNDPLDHVVVDWHSEIRTLQQARDLTSIGIDLHRELMGEFGPAELSNLERVLIGEAWQLFEAAGFQSNRRYFLPEIRNSYELHQMFRQPERGVSCANDIESSAHGGGDIDRVFGEYCPYDSYCATDPCVIVLYPRNIAAGAQRLGISPASLRAITLIHELGHFWAHKAGCSRLPDGIKTTVFEAASADWHESCAQTLVHFVGHLNRCSSSFSLEFLALLRQQSSPYRVFEQLLAKSTDSNVVFTALHRSRPMGPPPTFQDWITCIR